MALTLYEGWLIADHYKRGQYMKPEPTPMPSEGVSMKIPIPVPPTLRDQAPRLIDNPAWLFVIALVIILVFGSVSAYFASGNRKPDFILVRCNRCEGKGSVLRKTYQDNIWHQHKCEECNNGVLILYQNKSEWYWNWRKENPLNDKDYYYNP